MDKVRWGVLSTARIATEKVIPGIRRSATGEVVAIASRDGGRARAAADGSGSRAATAPTRRCWPIRGWTRSTSRCRTTSTRSGRSGRWAGKHVLCEKPLALSAADAARMADAATASGRLLMEAFMYRHHPSWVAVQELVAGGRIGRLQAVDSWFSYFLDDPANIRNVLEYGGGALYDIGCYSVSLSRLLFGAEPDEVSAAIVRDPASGVDILTTGHMTVRGRPRVVHLRDARGARPARPRLRDRWPDRDRDPVQHPARPPHADLRHPGR